MVLSEQYSAVRFRFQLGKNAARTVIMLNTAFKDDALGKTQVFEWLSSFKRGEMKKKTTNHALDAHQHQEPTKMLLKFVH